MNTTSTPSTTTNVDLLLAQTSTEALLDAMIQLTHRIHGLRATSEPVEARRAELRGQRALVRAELIRRDERRLMLEAGRLQAVPA